MKSPLILLIVCAVNAQNACIENLLDGADSRVRPDDHKLGTLSNITITATWDNAALRNRTLDYQDPGSLSIQGTIPDDAVVVYSRRSESFRHAGSTTVIQRPDQVAPVSWTFDRVGTFTISVFVVPDYDSNIDNDECSFYVSDTVEYVVEPKSDMIELASLRTFTQCDLCPDDEQLSVSDAAIFIPTTGVEQTCAGWFQDGINGRLNPQLCDTLQNIEANDNKCSCDPEGTIVGSSSRWLNVYGTLQIVIAVVVMPLLVIC